jgi:hypothetical protein
VKRTVEDKWVHVVCALWCEQAEFLDEKVMEPVGGEWGCAGCCCRRCCCCCFAGVSGRQFQARHRIPCPSPAGLNEVTRGKKCEICGKNDGFSVTCTTAGCKAAFHGSCGRRHGNSMEMAEDGCMTGLCKKHSQK